MSGRESDHLTHQTSAKCTNTINSECSVTAASAFIPRSCNKHKTSPILNHIPRILQILDEPRPVSSSPSITQHQPFSNTRRTKPTSYQPLECPSRSRILAEVASRNLNFEVRCRNIVYQGRVGLPCLGIEEMT
jgi:hypothetical protein